MNCLECRQLSVTRGGERVLDHVDFSLEPGELVGLIGPNGSGKTTLLRALSGLQSRETGEVRLAGSPIETIAPAKRARLLGYLPQHAVFHWPITVRDAIMLGRHADGIGVFGPSASDRETVAAVLGLTGLTSIADRAVDTLSGGEAMRVHLARLFAGGHAVLVADEPATSLDPRFQLELIDLLREQASRGAGVVLSLHDLSLAFRACDRIVVMREGTIVAAGPPAAVLDDPQLAEVFGIELEKVRTADGLTIIPGRRGGDR